MADTFIYSGSKIPPGGEIGQVLTKVGGPNYYAAWRTPQTSTASGQAVVLTGDITGSGLGTIATTLANTGVSAGTYNNSATQVRPFTIDAKGRITNIGTGVTITPAFSSITGKPTTLSGYGITDAATSTHVHGNIANGGAIGSIANLPIITTTGGLLTVGSFGTSASTFCEGNDARLSDTRNTTNSIVFNSSGTGDSSGASFNGSAAKTISYNTIGAQPLDATLTGLAAITTASGSFIYATASDVFTTSTISSFALTLVDDSDAATMRTTLGLGTMAIQDAGNVSISGGTIDGIIFDDGTY